MSVAMMLTTTMKTTMLLVAHVCACVRAVTKPAPPN
jgi:hypothetical protein